MNENINLCEILKGHEGETFYSPIYGNIKLHHIQLGQDYPIIFLDEDEDFVSCCKDGKLYNYTKECLIFPSKDQRDWNKWDEENNKKTPKTWSELVKMKDTKDYFLEYHAIKGFDYEITSPNPIEKSALALLKIHQLIEVGYGGNVTNEEWISPNYAHYAISLYHHSKHFEILQNPADRHLVLFHTKEQAEEFLKHPENIQLLKDYYMI